MVDDSLRYHTREVVGGDIDNPSAGAESRALYADGLDVLCDGGSILGWPATWGDTASAAATCAALLTSGISARWSHRYLDEGLNRGGEVFGSLKASGAGTWWGEEKGERRTGWFYRLSINPETNPATTRQLTFPTHPRAPRWSVFRSKRSKEKTTAKQQ